MNFELFQCVLMIIMIGLKSWELLKNGNNNKGC